MSTQPRLLELPMCGLMPCDPDDANQLLVMLRLWREVCVPAWEREYWPVAIAASYSVNAWHDGAIYRFDGWTRVNDDCGSIGGGTYSRRREAGEAIAGKKTLWLYRYPVAVSAAA